METLRSREFCHSDELKGETVHEVLSPWQVPEITHLGTYNAYALRMRSGKLFCITTCMGQVQFSRITPDMEPVPEAPRDRKKEELWVVKVGSKDGKDVFVLDPERNTRTTDLDAAFGWKTRADARLELEVWVRHAGKEGTLPALGRRRTFRR